MARCLDLDKVTKDRDYVQIGGKKNKYYFKDLKLEESVKISHELDDFLADSFNMTNDDEALPRIHELILKLIDIPVDIVEQLDIDHFVAIVQFLQRKPFYDKGFTDKELDAIEKKAMKQKILDEMIKKE